MPGSILLVDDNKAFIDSVKDVLEDESYSVVTAYNGEDACRLAREKRFDLVLMDIKMPGMNGVEVFLEMKKQDPEIKVVLITAYALSELIQEAHENGVLAVLKKPLEMEHLITIIEQAKQPQRGGWILIADDDRELCENLYDNLVEHGYRVAITFEAEEAITKAKQQDFDALLLDLKIPKIDGLHIYRQIKQVQPNLVTILMTGYMEEMKEAIGHAINENAYTILPKPIQIDNLLKLLSKISESRNKDL